MEENISQTSLENGYKTNYKSQLDVLNKCINPVSSKKSTHIMLMKKDLAPKVKTK